MFEIPLTLYRFNLAYLHQLTEDIPNETFSQAAFSGGKPARWIFGHLAISHDFIFGLLGEPTTCPQEWMTQFGPGSDPHITGGPTATELLAAIHSSAKLVEQAVPRATPEQLAARHSVPIKILLRHTPTVGDLVGHLLTTHMASHLGQLSVWRRQMGYPVLF